MSVFITGATGFIAKHIISDLLKENYTVIGTVRNETKAKHLLDQFKHNPNLTLEIVADISQLDAFDQAFAKHASEIKYVLHAASPFTLEINDPVKDLLTPAINGTKSILSAIKKFGSSSVEKLVVTSSYAAIMDLDKEMDPKTTFSEKTWNPDSMEYCQRSPGAAYNGSKVFAEKAAWNFLEENKDNVKFTLTTVNPVYVFGPQAVLEDVRSKLNTSCEIINKLVHSQIENDSFDDIYGAYIDVRDVARAHIMALQDDKFSSKRLFLTNGRFKTQDMLDILNSKIPILKGKIAVGKPGTGVDFHDPGAKIDNSATRELLGFSFKTLEETVVDTATQILEHEGRI